MLKNVKEINIEKKDKEYYNLWDLKESENRGKTFFIFKSTKTLKIENKK